MDKKPLIGVSICAVVLLVLGSLSNVVGYQSVKSTMNDSPLFATRTQRATNQQQNSLTSQYLGMGKENPLQFPIRDDKIELLTKVIDMISKMDDKTFAQFTELLIQKARQDTTLKDTNSTEIIQVYHLLKTKPEIINNSFITRNNQEIFPTYEPYTLCAWSPGCFIIGFIGLLIKGLIIVPLAILLQILWELLEPIIVPLAFLLYCLLESLKSHLTYAVCKTDSGILHIL